MISRFYINYNNSDEFNYSVHISQEFCFVYFNNPKCACTTIKASLNLACAKLLGRDLTYDSISDIHNRRLNFLRTPAELGNRAFDAIMGDPSYFKFCFVREPVQRLMSAFASKLTWQSEGLTMLNRRLGRADDKPLGFEEFIDIIAADSEIRDMDEHWRLQRKQVCFDLVRFDRVGLFEQLERDLRDLLQRIFGAGAESTIYDVRQHFIGNVSNGAAFERHLTSQMRQKIVDAYQEDVDLYRIAMSASSAG